MLLQSENSIECHEEFLSLQAMSLPKRFDFVFPCLGGAQKFLDAFRLFFLKIPYLIDEMQLCCAHDDW